MESRFDSYERPPAPEELDIEVVWPHVEREAQRQLDQFYPVMDNASLTRTRKVIEAGILQMLRRGAARLEDGVVEFWNPVEGRFQPYDREYNDLMLSFMSDFKGRYQEGLRRKASYN